MLHSFRYSFHNIIAAASTGWSDWTGKPSAYNASWRSHTYVDRLGVSPIYRAVVRQACPEACAHSHHDNALLVHSPDWRVRSIHALYDPVSCQLMRMRFNVHECAWCARGLFSIIYICVVVAFLSSHHKCIKSDVPLLLQTRTKAWPSFRMKRERRGFNRNSHF